VSHILLLGAGFSRNWGGRHKPVQFIVRPPRASDFDAIQQLQFSSTAMKTGGVASVLQICSFQQLNLRVPLADVLVKQAIA